MSKTCQYKRPTKGPWVCDCNEFGAMKGSDCFVRDTHQCGNGMPSGNNGIMVIGTGSCNGFDDYDFPSLKIEDGELIAAAGTSASEIEDEGYYSIGVMEALPDIMIALETISTHCKDVEMRRSTREFLNKLRRQ